MSPAISASRILPEDMRSPSSTPARRSPRDAVLPPSVFSGSTLPLRPLPKLKSSPVTTPAAPIFSASSLGYEFLGAGLAQLLVELEHQHRVRPGVGEQLLALVEAGQAEGGHVGLEVA